MKFKFPRKKKKELKKQISSINEKTTDEEKIKLLRKFPIIATNELGKTTFIKMDNK